MTVKTGHESQEVGIKLHKFSTKSHSIKKAKVTKGKIFMKLNEMKDVKSGQIQRKVFKGIFLSYHQIIPAVQ